MASIQKVDAIALVKEVLPGALFERRAPRRHGLVYTFVLPDGRRFDFMVAVRGDAEAAKAAFDEQKSGAVRSPGPAPARFAVGDASAYWTPSMKYGGSLLFRRENVVIYLRGSLLPDEYAALGQGLDQALVHAKPPVATPGIPVLPKIDILVPQAPVLMAEARSSRGQRMDIQIPADQAGDLELFAPDFKKTKIDRTPPPTLVFYPREPAGDQPIEVVAYVLSTNTVASRKRTVTVRHR